MFTILISLYYLMAVSSCHSSTNNGSTTINYIYNGSTGYYLAHIGFTNKFCDANTMCSSYGKTTGQQASLIGIEYLKLKEDFSNISISFWTRLNQIDLLNLNSFDYVDASIYWMDGISLKSFQMKKFKSDLNIFLNQINHKSYSGKNVLYYSSQKKSLQTTCATREHEIGVICEIVTNSSEKHVEFIQTKKFRKYLYKSGEQFISPSPYFDGCYPPVFVSSETDCIHRCAVDVDCLAFFHNSVKNWCILKHFTGSQLPHHLGRVEGEWTGYKLTLK
uniref:Apple domain-containing protein n=1 Tax=Trichobilharzia regenti TaxID=157069 RepID=A0AA85JGH1_TRIRE|nr:unnamed protein product [Trichobilharzia regenti]